MKLALFLPIFVVFISSNLRYSSAFPADKDADYDENKLGEDGFGGFGSAEIMPGRDLSEQELKNIIYIAMQDVLENNKKYMSKTMPADSNKLSRKKRFILAPLTRNGTTVNSVGNGANFWQGWAQRRRQRIERRRQRWRNFQQRQQAFFRTLGRQGAANPQIVQSMASPVGPINTGHRIILSSSNSVNPTAVPTHA